MGGLGEALDGGQPAIPGAGQVGHGPRGLVEPVGVHPEQDLPALLPPDDQPGVLEHDEVLGDGLPGEGDLIRQRAGGGLTSLDEEVETKYFPIIPTAFRNDLFVFGSKIGNPAGDGQIGAPDYKDLYVAQ